MYTEVIGLDVVSDDVLNVGDIDDNVELTTEAKSVVAVRGRDEVVAKDVWLVSDVDTGADLEDVGVVVLLVTLLVSGNTEIDWTDSGADVALVTLLDPDVTEID